MEKFARKCYCCGEGMSEGYLDDNATFCSIECLITTNRTNPHTPLYTEQDWEQDCDDNPDVCYWTSWHETIEEEDEFYNDKGVLFRTDLELQLYERLKETNIWADNLLDVITDKDLLPKDDNDYLELSIQLAPNEILLRIIEQKI